MTYQPKRQLNYSIRPMRLVLPARRLASRGENHVVGHDHGLLHGRARIGVAGARVGNVAARIDVGVCVGEELERRLDFDVPRRRDRLRGQPGE